MARAENTDVVDSFEAFFREYCRDDIGDLAQKYPTERKSLYVDYQQLYRFDRDLAADVRDRPAQLREYAEEALRLYDLPIDVSLGQAHVRFENLPETTEIREIRADHRGRLLAVQGIVRKATDVRPKITTAAFECQRCGTLTRIPQGDGSFQEPHECQGCERQGPFEINFDQSEFVDAQKLRVQESPEGLRGGETPQSIDVHIEDDVTGEVTAGDNVRVSGVLRLEQQGSEREQSPLFDVYMEGMTVAIEDEQFEEMDIDASDKERIVELAGSEDIYDRVVDSIAPSIYGYDKQKLAIALQLFSGVTKNLPDGSRIRGDLHLLLIGDPGTGKCVAGETPVRLADGSTPPIRDLVEANLDDPRPVDDGVWDRADVALPTLAPDGSITTGRATRVWKREAPDRLYRVRTATGREMDVTPSHPLFVVGDGVTPTRADRLAVGDLLAAAPGDIDRARSGARVATDGGPIAVDRIVGIETVAPDDEWVYDLEVEGTHSYVSNGIFSHNSQLLQYIRNIAPRSVYTSGKGASSAGLCVTGDTRVHTSDGFRSIESIVDRDLPDPVDTETSVPRSVEVQTYDRDAGSMQTASSSHVWRMPEKPCRRIETTDGRELEASVNTPVLTCGENGLEWTPISEIEPGDHVARPDYGDLDRTAVPVRDYLDLRTEKLLLSDETVEWLRKRLTEEFGTLRDAAAALDLSEDFIYCHLKNRHVPLEKLDWMLDAIGATRTDVEFDRLMCRHGDGITIPDEFDADLLYLLGLVFGDGDIALDHRGGNRGLVRISNSDERLLGRAQEIFDTKFDYRPTIERQDDRVPCIRVHSATIARLFANAGMTTPKTDLKLDPRLTTARDVDAFLRGLMDADGSVSARDAGGSSVLLSTISADLADQLQLMFETYGVEASVRERDRRGTTELDDGHEIESRHVQYSVEIYGADIDRYAESIGFEVPEKQAALDSIVDECARRDDRVPVGSALATAGGSSSKYYHNLNRGDNPGRDRARSILAEVDLGSAEPTIREAVEADLHWGEVVAAVDTGEKEVYDLTIPETHNFVGNGIVTHNTAAAVRDDFGDGQQWTLEAGALVLADQGIAAVDELDKMESSDRSAMHEALEQQSYHPKSPLRLADGRRRQIGEFVDQRMADRPEDIVDGVDCELLSVDDVSVRSADLDDGDVRTLAVDRVSRHEAPEEFVRITYSNEEWVIVTPDHPVFVAEDDGWTTIPAAEVRPGRSVPAPISTDGGTATAATAIGTQTVEAVDTVPNAGEYACEWVYDVTVEPTNTFVSAGVVLHNSISISKAGINATLKSRCSLLGAANPKYGRFDQYEPIGEQIDLEPALVSRFDLIFTVTDQPDPDEDAELAEHILTTNYAGELDTHRTNAPTPNYGEDDVAAVADEVEPAIDPDLLRKYVAYAKRSCFPTMTETARDHLRDFYVDLRTSGADEDAPVPVTARKLEALVRLAEASARVRLGDRVTEADARRATDIASYCLEDIGMDPETGELDADVIETGTSKSQRDRIKNIKAIIADIEDEYDEGAPVDVVIERAEEAGTEPAKAEHEIEKLKQKGEVYEPRNDHLRTT